MSHDTLLTSARFFTGIAKFVNSSSPPKIHSIMILNRTCEETILYGLEFMQYWRNKKIYFICPRISNSSTKPLAAIWLCHLLPRYVSEQMARNDQNGGRRERANLLKSAKNWRLLSLLCLRGARRRCEQRRSSVHKNQHMFGHVFIAINRGIIGIFKNTTKLKYDRDTIGRPKIRKKRINTSFWEACKRQRQDFV